jgi:hypothetical protein
MSFTVTAQFPCATGASSPPCRVNAAISVAASGSPFVFSSLHIESGASVTFTGTSSLLQISTRDDLIVDAGAGLTFASTIVNVSLVSGAPMTINGTVQLDGYLAEIGMRAPSGALFVGGQITASSIVASAASMRLHDNAALSTNGRGFSGGLGAGAGSVSDADPAACVDCACSAAGGGGGFGGTGGNGNSSAQPLGFYSDGSAAIGGIGGTTYGSDAAPFDFGSGGAGYAGNAGFAGGGRIRLSSAGAMYFARGSTISADGASVANPQCVCNCAVATAGSAGSGGSIWIAAASLGGGGLVSAAGGNLIQRVQAAGGGGGRIRFDVPCTSLDAWFRNSSSARGGVAVTTAFTATVAEATGNTGQIGADGTITYLGRDGFRLADSAALGTSPFVCVACGSGTTAPATMLPAQCETCPAGSYCVSGSPRALCMAGFYCDEGAQVPDQNECVPPFYCAPGSAGLTACMGGYVTLN